jgi:hypothetical protein
VKPFFWAFIMKIKNWSEFQHFKDRTPPWIKLYRHLLDDPDWHELSGDDAKTLIMLWLVASEDKDMDGNLPSIKNTAFRLRTTETKLNQSLNKLSHWLIHDDINVISEGYQHDAPETETETEVEKKSPRQKENLLANIDPQVAKDYLAIRKAKKLPLTKLALDKIESEGKKVGFTLEETLRLCCEKSWAGFSSKWDEVKELAKPKDEDWYAKAKREGKVL